MKKIIASLLALVFFSSVSQAQIITGPPPSAVGVAVPGQIPGTGTNDNACTGCVGEVISESTTYVTATVTITIAAPGVVTWTGHPLVLGSPVNFTTTVALPTGLVAGTTYWAIPIDANTFKVASSIANAIAGTAITTSGSQSGVQTAFSDAVITTTATAYDAGFIVLTPGDYNLWGVITEKPGTGTIITQVRGWISTASATFPTDPNGGATLNLQTTLATASTNNFPVGFRQITVPAATTTIVYLGCEFAFTVASPNCTGGLWARRAR